MRPLAAIAALAAGLAAAADAAAAPQVLGLTASRLPIPLTCDDNTCTAIAGTFCLQRERAVPTYGTRYEASRPDQLTLTLLDADGTIRQIDGGPWVAFSAYSDYTMVRMSVPRSLLAAHGAAAIAAEIGPGVALVPAPQIGDGNPQGEDEIALATGPLRIAATHYLDQRSPDVDAARLVASLVNALPEWRTIHDDFGNLWSDIVTADLTASVTPAAIDGARRAYGICRDQSDLRHCLIARHRELMMSNNKRFWDESAGY